MRGWLDDKIFLVEVNSRAKLLMGGKKMDWPVSTKGGGCVDIFILSVTESYS